MRKNDLFIASTLERLFPEAQTALHFHNPFECICAVMLSAQTTDEAVNRVTPRLFLVFPTPQAMAEAEIKDVEDIIKSIGLYHNKAANLVAMSKILVEKYDGSIPGNKEELVALPGVGIKTANVVGAECFHIPAIAVDTHVARVAKRLGYAKENDNPERVEAILEKRFPTDMHIRLHHRLIHFGRFICHARNPECHRCPFTEVCSYFKKTSSIKGK